MSAIEYKNRVYTVEECEETLNAYGYICHDRPSEDPQYQFGAHVVYAPQGPSDYTVAGNDRNALIIQAIEHLEDTIGHLRFPKAKTPNPEDTAIDAESIGSIDVGSGRDQYVLLSRKDGEPLTPDAAEAWLLPRVYNEGSGPGSYFCHAVQVAQKPFSDHLCIGIIQHRRDI